MISKDLYRNKGLHAYVFYFVTNNSSSGPLRREITRKKKNPDFPQIKAVISKWSLLN